MSRRGSSFVAVLFPRRTKSGTRPDRGKASANFRTLFVNGAKAIAPQENAIAPMPLLQHKNLRLRIERLDDALFHKLLCNGFERNRRFFFGSQLETDQIRGADLNRKRAAPGPAPVAHSSAKARPGRRTLGIHFGI